MVTEAHRHEIVLSASTSKYVGAFPNTLATAIIWLGPTGWLFTYQGCVQNHDPYGPFDSALAAQHAAKHPRTATFSTYMGDL